MGLKLQITISNYLNNNYTNVIIVYENREMLWKVYKHDFEFKAKHAKNTEREKSSFSKDWEENVG